VIAHAAFVVFARLEDFYRRGLDRVDIVGGIQVEVVSEEDLEFYHFFENPEAYHIIFCGLEKNHTSAGEGKGMVNGEENRPLEDKVCVALGTS
jgi:hypothetical protein